MEHPSDLDQIVGQVWKQLSSGADGLLLRVGAEEIPFEQLGRIRWSRRAVDGLEAVTQLDVVRYYTSAAPVLLPSLLDRPLIAKRYQNHEEGSVERFWREDLPSFINTVPVFQDVTNDNEAVILVQNIATLLWLVSSGCLEFYPWLSRITPEPDLPNIFINSAGILDLSVLNYPDYLVFRLEAPRADQPTADQEPTEWLWPDTDMVSPTRQRLQEAAIALGESLTESGLSSLPLLVGWQEIQLFVPIPRMYTYPQVRQAAKALRTRAVEAHPDLLTSAWQMSERQGRVFAQIDQLGRGKLTVAPYSLVFEKEPVFARPVSWSELRQSSLPEVTLAELAPRLSSADDPSGIFSLPDDWQQPQQLAAALPAELLVS